MKLRPLLIGPEQVNDAKRVVAHAEANPLSLRDLFDVVRGSRPPIGDNPSHVCVFPLGYRICFSIENQPEPMGWCRHISISVGGDGYAPNPVAIDEIAKHFGFVTTIPTACVTLHTT